MNSGIYAVVRPYTEKDICICFRYKCNDYYGIYDKIMELTDNNHEESSNAASWCELATIGEIYEFCEGEIEIMEID